MTKRTFPPTGNAKEEQVKIKAGYVEYVIFANQHLGYFCGTCPAFLQDSFGQQGFCNGLKVPVVSFGCCNNWRLDVHIENWVGASGQPA